MQQESNQQIQIEELHLERDIKITVLDWDNHHEEYRPQIDCSKYDLQQMEGKQVEGNKQKGNKGMQNIKTEIVKKKVPSNKHIYRKQSQDEVIMKGSMERGVSKLLTNWQKRFCFLTKRQLFCFESESRNQLISCIHLKLLPCSVTKQTTTILVYYSPKYGPATFRVETQQQAQQWYDNIKQVIGLHSQSKKLFINVSKGAAYSQKNIVSQAQFLSQAQSGDILLMKSGSDLCCQFQRAITNSQYDHMAMVMKYDDGDVKIFESNPADGVKLYNWNDYHKQFNMYEKVAYRRLVSVRKKEVHHKLMTFVKGSIGGGYSMGAMKMLKLRSHHKEQEMNNNKKRNFFCSELIAKAYKHAELIEPTKPSSSYWPTDFTERGGLVLLEEGHFDPQRVIVLAHHIKLFG